MSSFRFFRLSGLMNISVAISKDGKSATVRLPGLGIDDFNRAGGIAIWRVLHWFSWSRIAAYHVKDAEFGSSFLEYDKMTSDVFTFMASTRTTVNSAFYHLLESSSSPVLSIKLHLGYIGASSLNSVAVLSDINSGSVLAQNVNQVVCIDKTTRKPTPIPDWWKQKYESFVEENERLVLPLLNVPIQSIYKYDLKVSWNDTDVYKHVNYQSYIKYCFDAAMDAVNREFYSGFRDDILNYNVKSIDCSYKGESVAGDMITVVTWQNVEIPSVLHFSIEKQGNVVFQSSVEFYL